MTQLKRNLKKENKFIIWNKVKELNLQIENNFFTYLNSVNRNVHSVVQIMVNNKTI